jgi:hypothetical protein
MFHPFEYAGPVRLPPPTMQLRIRREFDTKDSVNARQFEAWTSGVPVVQGGAIADEPTGNKPTSYDMAPQNTRTDKRDYRQAQPFVPDGPSLAMNPYFDRYDPTRDPRNMIREMRSAVYEVKEGDRGAIESRRLTERGFTSRWVPEGTTEETSKASLMALEVMRPKMDDINTVYRDGGRGGQVVSTETTWFGSKEERDAAIQRERQESTPSGRSPHGLPP